MPPLPDDRNDQGGYRHGEEDQYEVARKPIFGLAAVKDDFEARKPQGHEDNSQAVNLEPAVAPRGFDLTRELGRIRYQTLGENQRQDSDGNVDEENPAPTPVVGDPAAQRRTYRRCGDDGHAVKGKSRRPLARGKCVYEYRLLHWCKAASPNALQDAEENQQPQAGRQSTQQGTHCEQENASHVIALTSKHAAQPRGKRQHDSVGHQIAGQHPGALVVTDGKTARDMWQGDVGDSGVEQLHECSQRDDDCDYPGIDSRPLGGYVRDRNGGRCSAHTCSNASFDASRDRSVASKLMV